MFFDYISGKSRPGRKYREEVKERKKDSCQDYEFKETFHLTTNEHHFRKGRIEIPMMSYSTICILVDKILISSELIQEAISRKRFSKDRGGERNYIVFTGNAGKIHKRETHRINTPFTFICG